MAGLDADSREVAASMVADLKLPPLGIPPRSRGGGCQLLYRRYKATASGLDLEGEADIPHLSM